ncbi:MAG: hypothetical protein WAU62_07185, partial [Dehalococcoidales bacterium]
MPATVPGPLIQRRINPLWRSGPKPPFKPIFQAAATKQNSEIRIINEPIQGSPVFLVETGESSNPSSQIVNSIVKERGAYGIEFILSRGVQ